MEKKKGEKAALQELPLGIKELIDIGEAKKDQSILETPSKPKPKTQPILLPPAKYEEKQRPKTEKEKELDALISQRQKIIEELKKRNPIVLKSRKTLASLLPKLQGKGMDKTLTLLKKAEEIEFSIATEAYTPQKEKELLKNLNKIKESISNYKELEGIKKDIEHERKALRTTLSQIREFEAMLLQTRKKCDETYAAILAERKAAYEERQRKKKERMERAVRELTQRVKAEKKRRYEEEISKYKKNYEDTVLLSDICIIEKKEKKNPKKEAV